MFFFSTLSLFYPSSKFLSSELSVKNRHSLLFPLRVKFSTVGKLPRDPGPSWEDNCKFIPGGILHKALFGMGFSMVTRRFMQ